MTPPSVEDRPVGVCIIFGQVCLLCNDRSEVRLHVLHLRTKTEVRLRLKDMRISSPLQRIYSTCLHGIFSTYRCGDFQWAGYWQRIENLRCDLLRPANEGVCCATSCASPTMQIFATSSAAKKCLVRIALVFGVGCWEGPGLEQTAEHTEIACGGALPQLTLGAFKTLCKLGRLVRETLELGVRGWKGPITE